VLCEHVRQARKTATLPVSTLCRLVGLSRATYYRSLRADRLSAENHALLEEVKRIALRWSCYGSRRIRTQLHHRGWKVGRERVQRIVRENGLQCARRPTRWLATTDSRHSLPVYPNLVNDWRPTGINQLWVTDVTYIRLPNTFVYLAAILDGCSRRVIGWALDRHLRAELCLEALQMALRARHYPRGVIHHSDRGVQYCSKEYAAMLEKYEMRGSMARKGYPYDNSMAESFWKTLKYEQVYRQEYRTIQEARADIGAFIERTYNRRRPHSALGYRSPIEFEAAARKKD
jgi:putative transposase